MKNNRLWIIPLAALLVTLACRVPGLNTGTPETPPGSVAGIQVTVVPQVDSGPADNPCNNILFPLAPNRQWIYTISSEGKTSEIGMTVANISGSQATIDALDMNTGLITQTRVDCEAGAIKNFPLMTMELIFGNYLDGAITTQYQSGLVAPAEPVFTAGNWAAAWEGSYLTSGQAQLTDGETTATITLNNSPVKMKWQTDGAREAITVPAGTYPTALKVTREITVDATVQVTSEGETVSGSGQIILNTTNWFEPHTGMLRMQVDSASLAYRGFRFPVDLSLTIEMQKYIP